MMLFFNYRQMIQEYLLPRLEDLNMQNLWFQKDRATLHTARETIAILRAAFPLWSFNHILNIKLQDSLFHFLDNVFL